MAQENHFPTPTQHCKYAQSSESVEEYPDRVFVGGFPETVQEDQLAAFFAKWVEVREVKILRYDEHNKKSFGFLTLTNEEAANKLKNLSPEKLVFNGQRLNIGPARKRIHSSYKNTTRTYEGFAVVTPDGYNAPGTYTFSLDKAPHFIQRSPTKTLSPVTSQPSVACPSAQSTSGQSLSFVTNEHEMRSFSEEKIGIREANNNISQVFPPGYGLDSFYPPFLPYFPIAFSFLDPNFQMQLQQPRIYPQMYKEHDGGGNFKPYYAS